MDQPAKRYRLSREQIKPLATGYGGCIASDMITVEGRRVGYMYRDEPAREVDSGWRFLSGEESADYMDDARNHAVYDVNTIANYDADVIPFLESPVGTAFERDPLSGVFVPVVMLHPGYPVVEGRHHITEQWSIQLPQPFSRRVEDGSVVLWRPGLTLWSTTSDNPEGQSQDQRMGRIRRAISPDAFANDERREGGVARIEYRLTEEREEGEVHTLHGWAFGRESDVQVTFYFDDEEDLAKAASIWHSLQEHA